MAISVDQRPSPQPSSGVPGEGDHLASYWLAYFACIATVAVYVALIIHLGTETARRGSAPPWYAWYRFPPTSTRWQALLLVFPVIVYAGWRGMARKLDSAKLAQSLAVMAAFGFTLAINVSLAYIDRYPAKAISGPFDRPGAEYFWDVKFVGSVRSFLRDYISNLPHYGIHTRTHPPGGVLILYFFSRLIAPGVAVASWSAVIFTATAVLPVYLLARRIAGIRTAMLVLALYPVVPSLVLFGATSMDGICLVFLCWSFYVLHHAIHKPTFLNALLAGVVLWLTAMMSYVVVCVVVLMSIYLLLELRAPFRALGALLIAGLVSCGGFVCCYRFTGFNILHGLRASRFYDHYAMRTFSMSFARYLDISFCNLFAFLIGLGFPVVILWFRQISVDFVQRSKNNPPVSINFATALCVVVFSFGKLFTHETERIWIFFMPLVLIGAARAIEKSPSRSGRLLEWTMGLCFAQCWVFQVLLYTIW